MIKKPILKKIIIIVGVIVAIAVIFILIRKPKSVQQSAIVKRGELIQYVSVTGRVKPAQSVDLAFETTSRVSRILVNVGEKVYSGQKLAVLENNEVAAQLNQAEAALQIQLAELEELRKGTRTEELAVYESKLEAAKTSLAEAQRSLIDKIKDSYTKSDDSIRSKIDKFFDNGRSANPQLNLTISDSRLEREIEQARLEVENTLVSWNNSLTGLGLLSDLKSFLNQAKNNTDQVRSLLDDFSLAINSLTSAYPQATIDSYKTDVSTARTNVNIVITNLVVVEEKLSAAESSLNTAQKELNLKRAGATAEQISVQEASVRQSQAEVEMVFAQLEKTMIFSPIAGTVTAQEAKKGEIVSPGTFLISVISDAKFEIETNIPEADITKIKVGDEAKITLDAFGQEKIFPAMVIEINPAETMIEGVATYKTKLQFLEESEVIKSGMTANIDILSARRGDVLFIPQRAIVGKNGQKSVFIIDNKGKNQEVAVETGLRDSSGNIEIIQGLKEGDKVNLLPKEVK